MACEICDYLKKPEGKLFEDDDIIAYLAKKGVVPGHIIITTKKHYPIIEQIPDEIVSKLFIIANKISILIFEKLGAQGTNILVNNGVSAGQSVPHCLVNVIPRKQNDGTDFTWPPKQLDQETLSTIELQMNEEQPNETPVPKKTESKEQPVKEDKKEEEEDYLIKHMTRIP